MDDAYIAYQRDIGDIDGDGDTDVVAVEEGKRTIQVFRAPGWTRSTASAIAGTANDGLYQTERYDSASSPELSYSFALSNGDYQVNLHFAEIYSGAARVGGRVFEVWVEGQLRVDDLDIFSRVGVNAALAIGLPVTVSDGQLDITLGHGVENPKISAIEVLR